MIEIKTNGKELEKLSVVGGMEEVVSDLVATICVIDDCLDNDEARGVFRGLLVDGLKIAFRENDKSNNAKEKKQNEEKHENLSEFQKYIVECMEEDDDLVEAMEGLVEIYTGKKNLSHAECAIEMEKLVKAGRIHGVKGFCLKS